MENLTLSNKYGILRISDIKKCGKYKIVDAISTELDENLYLTGIIGKGNIEILSFEPDINIQYLSNNHFIVKKENLYYHYDLTCDNNPKLKAYFEKYDVIENRNLLIQNQQNYSIYNINKYPKIFYSFLTPFHYSPKYNTLIASFIDTIKIDEDTKVELVGMIDIENNFTNKSIYNITEDEFIKIDSIEEYLEYRNQIKTKTKTKENKIKKFIKKYVKSTPYK